MRKKNVGDILQNYFDAQNLNFLEHLEQQDLNLQNHFKMLENLFSSDNDSYQLEQKLKIEKNNLENKINSDNIKFKNKLEQQKAKTNKKLSGTNVYIPDNNHNGNVNYNRNRNRIRNNNRNRNNNEEKDKFMEYKKSKAISALPTFQYKYIINYEKRDENTCPICLLEFKEEDILIRFSCKEHIFHKKCLCTWLEKSDICPLCKKSLIIK
jgi:hypothetical protein